MSIQSPLSLSFQKINHADDFVRRLSRFPCLSLLMKSTMLIISSDVYPGFSSLSLLIKSTMLMISSAVYSGSPLSFNKINHVDDFVRRLSRVPSISLLKKSTMLMISSDVYPESPLSLF